MSNIGFHIENGVAFGFQPAAVIIPTSDPVRHPEVMTMKHKLANPALN